MVENLAQLVNEDPAIVRWGRGMNETFMVEVGETQFLLTVREGKIEKVEKSPFVQRTWRFAVRAKREAWEKFWQRVPAPGWHDLFALTKRGAASMEGDLRPLLQNLQYFKDLLALPRRAQ
jgi:predicted double-glycine peptidase